MIASSITREDLGELRLALAKVSERLTSSQSMMENLTRRYPDLKKAAAELKRESVSAEAAIKRFMVEAR